MSGPGGRRRRQRVLLVTPPYHCGMVESAGVWMPLGLAYLAAAAREAGADIEIYDAMSLFHDAEEVERRLEGSDADVVGVTACTPTVGAALEVLHAARRVLPRAVTVIGGVHPTFMADEVLKDGAVDYVVRGEGEAAFGELLACLAADGRPEDVRGLSWRRDGRAVHAPDRPLVADLDALPVAWDLIDWPTYYYRARPGSRLAISSWARGCTKECSFCSQQRMWRRTWRARSVEAIVAEAVMLRDRYGVDTLEVADEYPTLDRPRWERILDSFIAADLGMELLIETRADDIVRDEDILWKYRAAGVLHTYVGVESVRQDTLDAMHKDLSVETSRRAIALLNSAGIITETSFLFGAPGDPPDLVERTVRLAAEYDPDLAFFLAITPWPYADWYPEVADRVEVDDYGKYNLINPILRPDGMTRQELAAQLGQAFARFYGDKMRRLGSLPPEKREYMLRVARLLMEDSYLSDEVRTAMSAGHPGAVPAGHPGVMPGGHPGVVPAGHPTPAAA
jgi:anaerobic magnesium-protoporphyrin IX monomethyl ester cyclase